MTGFTEKQAHFEKLRSVLFRLGNLDQKSNDLISHDPAADYSTDVNKYESIIKNISEYIYSVTFQNGKSISTYHSKKSLEITGYTPEEYAQNPDLWFSMIHPDDWEVVNKFLSGFKKKSKQKSIEHRIIHKNKSTRWVSNTCNAELDSDGQLVTLNGFILDITDRKLAETRQQLAITLLNLLNSTGRKSDLLHNIVHYIKQYTGIEAVGIRLRSHDDFPYYSTTGFSESFKQAENSLCDRGPNGKPRCDDSGRPTLACMCGMIIGGVHARDLPCITEYRSFWTNSTTEFLESETAQKIGMHTRNRCNRDGYESVALIPLKHNEEIIGLLQLNDRRKGMFTLEAIQFFEGIGASIGITMSRIQTEEDLAESNERYMSIFENNSAVMLLINPENGHIVNANTAACLYYRYSLSKLTAMQITDINMLPADQVNNMMQSAQLADGQHGYFQHRLASGEIREVEEYISRIKIGGRILLNSIIHDITDRKRAEEALIVSEENLRQRNLIMEKDIQLAKIIQSIFIPSKAPRNNRLLIDYRYQPMEAVGGDYFSFSDLPDGGFGVFIGDVVGHGISAALFLSLIKSATDRVFKTYGKKPDDYLRILNAEIFEYMNYNFISAIYGLFLPDANNGHSVFSFSNGGHPKPILYQSSTGNTELLSSSGKLLGIFPELEFSEASVVLEKGDRIFLYTDGIPETKNARREIIGFENFAEIIRQVSKPTLQETLDVIIAEVDSFKGASPIEDDIVLIGIEVV